HPFTDVPEWASAYVGYLYHNNITTGVAEDLFGSTQTATSAQYATFILRALGYDDSAGDFFWDSSIEKMVSLDILTSAQASELSANEGAPRGDVAAISYYSLFANIKGTATMLIDKLYSIDKAITTEQLRNASVIDGRLTMFSNTLGISKPYPPGGELTSEEIYAKVSDAIFKIETKIMSDTDFGSGSGFFITSDGIAVTNMHVITFMSSASITTANGSRYPVEGIISLHPKADLAVIKVKGSGFSYLELGDPDLLRNAQRIYCVGSPYGFDNTISDGLVSNLKREHEGFTYIQISAPIAPGSSGGALLNEYGQAVGVTTAGFEQGSVNLAVPVSHLTAMHIFPTIRSVKYLQAHSHFGCLPVGDTYNEIEPNDSKPTQTMKNDTIMYGSITGADDVDCYALDVEKKAELLISLTSDELHSAGLRFELSDPSGKVILDSRHYSGEIFSLAMGHCASKGSYTVKVYAEDNGEDWSNVSYELYWISQPTIDDPEDWLLFFEFEPNDTTEHANYLPNNFIYLATISDKNDVDYYTFTLTKKSDYIAAVVTTGHEKSVLNVEVFDADNKSMGKSRYLDGYEVFSDTLPAGIYYIKVSVKDTKIDWDNEIYSIKGWSQ
ncbi:MAG: trypsin-like peptidase domain-containing protein, partial [Clostridiales bacterium]|nr:trypsin-like peptidase domain-containing protein [Clostridiales bacterium]